MSLQKLLKTDFTPAPFLVYKPQKNGAGQAMKLQLRLEPNWIDTDDGGYFEKSRKHGLFLEIAPQEGSNGKFPTFGWNSPKLIRCKLSLADVTKLLTSYREVRFLNSVVPAGFRSAPQNEYICSSYHRYGDQSTAINYTFDPTRGLLKLSKSKEWARSIALDLHEETAIFAYLELSLNAFLRVGIR